MITKSEWQAVHEQLMADDRRRVGDPPTAEEMLAYTRGELSAEQEARVRERLVCYPELVRTLTAEFPREGAEPGDPDYLSDAEFAEHWTALQKRMGGGPANDGGVLQFWRFTAAMAAAVAVALGVLLWQTTMRVNEPRIVSDEMVLEAPGRRGPTVEPQTLTAVENTLLVIPLEGQQGFTRYRIEIIDRDSNRALWSSPVPAASEDATSLAVLIPRRFLKTGTYDVVLYGTTGTTEERLAQWPLRVRGR